MFSSCRKVFTLQSKTISCLAIKTNGLLHLNSTNIIDVPKRYAVTDAIKNKFADFMERFNVMNPVNKNKLEANSWILYEKMIDQIPFNEIIKKLNLPDTFNSWFIITELHLWMVFVRLMNEGTKGVMARNFIVEALWNDVEFRSKKLGHLSSDIRSNQVHTLSEQLRGALIGYDEGWLTNDMVLASMVWRRVFNKECDDPEKLEIIVKYIRKQMSILQLQTFESLFTNKDIKWIKFI